MFIAHIMILRNYPGDHIMILRNYPGDHIMILRNYPGDHICRELPRQHRAGQTHLGQDGGIRAGQGSSTHSGIHTPWVYFT